MPPKTDELREIPEIDRREFLTTATAVGGALVLGFWLPPRRAEAAGTSVVFRITGKRIRSVPLKNNDLTWG